MPISEANRGLEQAKDELTEIGAIARAGASQSKEVTEALDELKKIVNELPFIQVESRISHVRETAGIGAEKAQTVTNNLQEIVGDHGSVAGQMAVSMSGSIANFMGEHRFPDGHGVLSYMNRLDADLEEVRGIVLALLTKLDETRTRALDAEVTFLQVGGSPWTTRMAERVLRMDPFMEKGSDVVSGAKAEITTFQQELNQ